MAKNSKSKKRSPLKYRPLRHPGQSLDEEIERIINEDAIPYLWVSLFAIFIAVFEWVRWIFDIPPNPILTTLLAVVILAISIYKTLRYRTLVQNYKLGRDGEKIVGQYLESLRASVRCPQDLYHLR